MSIQPVDQTTTEYNDRLPDALPRDFAGLPKLTREQCGHLRHFHNLASNLDGEWALMGNQEPGQEWLDSYRYQLAFMAYGAGVTHYHRLPAMRTTFKVLMKNLISKMLRREVWAYWYLTSQSGIFLDPSLTELRKPWADPVCKENIMYSGHLLLMISFYSMLFDDDSYDGKDSIVFDWDPVFWGFGPERFSYNRTTLQEAIIKDMERNGWIGVCCEPNCVFVVCNQFPIIAIRYNDIRNGTKLVDDVLDKYQAAWARKGMVGRTGLFRDIYRVKQDDVIDAQDPAFTAWGCAMMNSWNPVAMRNMRESLLLGFTTRTPDNRLNVNQPDVAMTIRRLVSKEKNADPNHPETVARAREIVSKAPQAPRPPYGKPTFGYYALFLSEIGAPVELDALLRHADTHLNPKMVDGGLYYARNDSIVDPEGNWKHVDPFTGNAAIGYARLNVTNGQKIMFEHPWTSEDVSSRPWIDNVDLSNGVDALSGSWGAEKHAMVAAWRTWDGRLANIQPMVRNLEPGLYGVYVNGNLVEKRQLDEMNDSIAVDLEVGGDDVDLVVLKAPVLMKSVL